MAMTILECSVYSRIFELVSLSRIAISVRFSISALRRIFSSTICVRSFMTSRSISDHFLGSASITQNEPRILAAIR